MELQPFIIFSLNGSVYGVSAICVAEVFFLPELTPIAEMPYDIAGAINLRGEIVPVMDLECRFGNQPQPYRASDSVIVLKWQSFQMGIVVNQVRDVVTISASSMTTDFSYGQSAEMLGTLKFRSSNAHFVEAIARVDDEIVMLLNPENLIRYVEQQDVAPVETLLGDDRTESQNLAIANSKKPLRPFCPHATPEQREIFRARAENLRHQIQSQDLTGSIPVAVIGLNEEYFGLELDGVREFTSVRQLAPIPCCPPHIIGNMNLRGEIVTLIDIRPVLNLAGTEANRASQAVVVQVGDLVAAIVVDRIFDVTYVRSSQLGSVPSAIQSLQQEYLRGTVVYADKMMSLLDLPKILTRGGLVVDEQV